MTTVTPQSRTKREATLRPAGGVERLSPGDDALALGISTSVFERSFTVAHIDELDASAVEVIEVVGPVPQCPFDRTDVRTELRHRLRDARVRLRSVHLPYGRQLDLSHTDTNARLEAVRLTAMHLSAAAALGARLAVLHPSAEPVPEQDRAPYIAAARQSLASLVPLAADLGVRLAVECLPRTCLGRTAAELLSVIDDVDPDVVGVCIDSNHLNLREPDLAAAVRLLGPRLLTLHCSENDGEDERHWLPGAPGGVIPWTSFLNALQEVRYEGPYLYELRPLGTGIAQTLRQIEDNFTHFVRPRQPRTPAHSAKQNTNGTN